MSKAPATRARKTSNANLRRLSLTTALGSLAAMTYGRSAYAGGCAGTGGTYLCTGAADPATDGEILIARDGPLQVTTEDGFGVDRSRVGGGSAIVLRSENGASFTTGEAVLIVAEDGTSGFDYGVGLDVSNLYGGEVEVDTTGAQVRGAAGIAVETFSFSGSYDGSANIFVTSGDASSTTGGSAIYALQASNADLGTDITIDSTAGKIISTGSQGVTARSRASAEYGTANITITTGDVDAAGSGISAVRDAFFSSADGFAGSSISIDARAGSVVSSAGSGISVRHEGLSSGGEANIAIAAADVSGAYYGIAVETNAFGYRSADLAIDTTAGTITGEAASGIFAAHTGVSDYGTAELSITTADVTGGTDGIYALSISEASESTTLAIDTSAGSVMGNTGLGIEALHYAQSDYGAARLAITTADVTGGTTGIFALNNAYAYAINDLVINTVAGSVTGESDAGIVAVHDGESADSDTDLLIFTADVTGATDGIYALNLGDAYGTSDLVIDTAAGSVVGQSGRGIDALHAGYSYSETANLIITTAGVRGGTDGIYAANEGNAYGLSDLIIDSSAGSVVGQTARGIDARHAGYSEGYYANLIITTAGVTGGTDGIYAVSESDAYGSSDLIIDSSAGSAVGQTARGIDARHAGYSEGYYANLIITTAGVTGGTDGIYAANSGSGYSDAELIIDTSAGSVEGRTGTGIDARQNGESEDGSTDLLIITADVTGAFNGIYAINSGYAYSFNDLEIDTTAGSVAGLDGIGIAARHEGQSSEAYSPADLVIFTANVSGGTTGIRAAHYGLAANSTAVIIDTAAGLVAGLSDTGINAVQGGQSAYASAELSITSAEVFGATDGINAINRGSAEYSVYLNIDSTYGSVTGQSDHGIRALQEGISRTGDADLIITTADVSGGTLGINAVSSGVAYGTSNVKIDTRAGAVVGTATRGISARNEGTSGSGTTDLIIHSADVRGGTTGIIARTYGSAYGSSDLMIDSTAGSVVGEAINGIDARNEGSSNYGTSDLVIAAANVTGGLNGIRVVNAGKAASSADLIIDSSAGSVAALSDTGIDVVQEGQSALASADLSITTAGVSGAADGIFARNRGSAEYSADLNIDTTYGSVSGHYFQGIRARQDGVSRKGTTDLIITTADVSGGFDGILAENYGSAHGTSDVIIDTSAGTVVGEVRHGIATGNNGSSESETTNLIVKSADVRGGSAGVLVRNYGTGAGASDLMIDSSAGSVVGETFYGIEARHFGSSQSATSNVIITAADVTGGTQGIYANTSVRAATDSVLVIDSVAGSVRGGGAAQGIRAISTAQSAGGYADIRIITADVSGGTTGIEAYGQASASGDVDLAIDTVAGTVTGETYDGISALQLGQSSDGSASLTITTADVTGASFGINTTNRGSAYGASDLIIDSSAGSVTGGTERGIYAGHVGQSVTGTTELRITTADVSGGTDGIAAVSLAASPYSYSSDMVIDTSAGAITGGDGSGITAYSAARSGLGTATLSITTSDVTGSERGISTRHTGDAKGNTTLTIDTARGAVIGRGAAGIFAQQRSTSNSGDASLVITTGNVSGASSGIDAFNAGTALAITASGAVSGGTHGIHARNEGTGGLTITARNDVTGSAGAAINAFNSANDVTASMRIDQAAGASFTGATDAISADNAGGSLTVNALGALTGTAGSGVNAVNQAAATSMALTVNNAAGAVSGIAANNQGSGAASVTLLGTAQGGSGAAIDTASAAGNLTTINLAAGAQALAGASGVAIANNAGDSVLNVAAGARMTGAVRLGAGNDAAILSGASVLAGVAVLDGGADTDALTLNGAAADIARGQIINWESITFAAGATIIAAGLETDTLTISGSSAQLVDLVAGSITTSDAQLGLGGATTLASMTTCGGALTIGGATAIGAGGILGCAAADNITLEGNASVAGNIEGAGGSDVIAVLGNASVAGLIRSGGAGSDGSAASDAANTITINTSGTIGAIEGGTGRDVMMLAGGSVTGAVLGGAGDDAIVLAGAAIGGALDGGAGDDVFTLASGSASAVLGGAGNDEVNWNAAAATTAAIRLGNGADTLSINDAAINLAGVVLDGGAGADTLNLNDAWSSNLAGANTANWDVINVNGGTLRISDNAITAGLIRVNMGGRLDGSRNLALTGGLALGAGAALLASSPAGTNAMTISGSVTNAGMIDLRGQAGTAAPGDRLTIGGDYTGLAGSSLVLGAVLASSGASDQLVVRGDLRGTSSVVVTNLGGTGGLTTGDGIRIVQVDGSSADGALTLAGGAVEVGAFSYGLQNGGIANPADQDWYLRSRTRGIAVATLSIARLAQDMSLAALGTLNQRTGEQSHAALQGGSSGFLKGMWGRALGKDYSDTAQSAILGDTSTEGRLGGLQMGADLYRAVASNGARTSIGVFGGHVWSATSDVSFAGFARSAGTTNSEGWSLGGYVTHVAPSGWYVDATILRDWLDHRASGADGAAAFTQSRTLLASLEMGKAFGSRWKFEPQAQLIYGTTRIDGFADSRGVANRIDADDSFIGRGGFRIKRTWDHDQNSDGGLFTIYAKANIWGRLDGGASTLAIGGALPALAQFRKVWGDAGIGTTFSLARNAEFFSDADVEFGIDQGGTALAGRGGFRLRF